MTPDRPHGAESQSRQLLRRNRAGGVLHGAHRSRARLHATIRCSPAASIPTSTRRSRGLAVPTSTRFRSTPRSRRCTTTSATACIARRSRAVASRTSRTRSAAAVRSRPARADSCRFPSRSPKTRSAASPRSSPSTTTRRRCSGTARPTSRRQHIIRAFRFELTKVQTPAVRRRVVATLRNVAEELAAAVAEGLGMPLPEPLPRALQRVPRPEVDASASAVTHGAPGRWQHRDPTHRGSRGRRVRRRLDRDTQRSARARRGTAIRRPQARAPSRPRKDLPSRRRSRWKPARRWFTTPSYCQREVPPGSSQEMGRRWNS